MTEDELVAWLGKSKLDTMLKMWDDDKTAKETRDKRHDKLRYQKTMVEGRVDDRWYEAHLRSAWTTVKGKNK